MNEELDFDIEIEEDGIDIDDIEIDLGDQEFELELDDEPKQETSKEEHKEKMVPLKALEAERKKWKERLEKQQKTMSKQKVTSESSFDADKFMKDQTKKYINIGYDEDTARIMAEEKLEDKLEMYELKQALKSNGNSASKLKRDLEYESLVSDPFYEDLREVREEVEELADRSGLSLKQAYNALYGETKYTKSRTDIERQLEQKLLANKQKKQSAFVDTSNTGSLQANTKIKLSADEIAIARSAGMTPKEYYAMKVFSSPEQYKKFKTKKG